MEVADTYGQVVGTWSVLAAKLLERTDFIFHLTFASIASACEGQVLEFNHPHNFIMLSTLNSLQPRQLLTQVPIPPGALLECAKFNFSRS